MHEIEGSSAGRGLKVAVVASRFNDEVVSGLVKGALSALTRCGVADDDVTLVHVPGALELPLATRRLAADGGQDAVVVLGAVIRGETDHYDFVCAGAMRGCAQVADDTGVPVLLGLLTCATLGQALARASDDERNKGAEVAEGAVAMATLLAALDERSESRS
jgi:6,7-dimethyl-8-ribityllumazine synthase